ncbi:complement C3-like isoform X2 [Ambystoma mexicanum]
MEETILIQAHEFTQEADVQITVRDFPKRSKEICRATTRLKEPNYLSTFTIKIPFSSVAPTFAGEKLYVVVQAKSESVPSLVLEKIILVSLHTGYIYIQTDKTIYTPSQSVFYRIFTTDQKLDPATKSVQVELQNPDGVSIMLGNWRVKDGLYSTSLQIPEYGSFGEWRIVARFVDVPEKEYAAAFEVKEYVLPSFEVQLTSKKQYIHLKDSEITLDIKASYTHKEPVQGHALATFGILHQSKKIYLRNSWQRVEVSDGKGSCTLKNETIYAAFEANTDLRGASVFVHVTVFSSGGDEVQAEKYGIRIVDSPFKIQFIQTPGYFKPGMPFQVSVIVTNPDESPAGNVDVIAYPGEVFDRTGADGVATMYIDSGSGSKELSIKVSTNDQKLEKSQQATVSLTATAYSTWMNSGNFLNIRVGREEQRLSVTLFTKHASHDVKTQIEYFTILLVAKGSIFKVLRQKQVTGAEITTLSIEIVPQMWPSFRIVAYYYLTQRIKKEIVSDSVWIDMPDVCVGKLELKAKDSSVVHFKHGKSYKLELTADEGAKVGLVAVDKAVYFLNKKNKLTQKKVWETVKKNDIGCTYGSGKNNLKVFEDAGLDFTTNVGVETEARTELNCPPPQSRKRRTVTNVELKTSKENEYTGELRSCCRAGFHENLMELSCEQRKAHVQLGEDCKNAFHDCCLFAEKLEPERREELIWARLDEEEEWGEDGFDDDTSVMIRTSFPESWSWHVIDIPRNPSESDVTMPVSVSIPDTITTWEMVAVSIRKDKGICVSQPLEMVIRKEFFVDLKLPYSVVRNEHVEIKAVLYNHQDEAKKVRVLFQYNEKLCSIATRSKGYSVTVNVPRHNTLAVPYVVIPLEIGKIAIEVQARQQYGIPDGIQKTLNVVAEGTTVRLSRSILLDPKGKSQTEMIQRSQFNDIVPNTEPENIISIQGNVLGESLLGTLHRPELQTLITLPRGCPEQHLFSTTPNVILTKFLDDTRQWHEIGVNRRKEAIQHITDGYNKQMITFRRADASFSGSTWLTAYVVKIFGMAYELVAVDAASVCKSVEWLLNTKQMPDGAFIDTGRVYTAPMQMSSGSEGKESLTAFVLIALNETKEMCTPSVKDLHDGMQKATKYLERRLPSLKQTYSAVITSYALSLVGSTKANDVIDQFSSNKTYWPFNNDQQSMYTVEVTAYALLQKIHQKKYDDMHRIAEWLIAQRRFGGGYISTQSTAITLQALAQYKLNAKDEDQMRLNVTLQISDRVAPKTWIVTKADSYQERSEQVRANKDIKVEATGSGKGTLTVRTVYQSLPSKQVQMCNAFNLRVSLEPVKHGGNDNVEATFKLTIWAKYLGNRDAAMTIIDIKMLTAFFPEEKDLKKLMNGIETYIDQYEPQTTANNGSVIMYLNKVTNQQETVLSFKVHQSLQVELLQPAAVTIYEYYDPDKRCTTFYNVPKQSGHIRKLCLGSACKCAEESCAVQQEPAKNITNDILNKAACDVGVDYAYRVKLTKTDSDIYDKHSMSILSVIKSGTDTDIGIAGAVRLYFSHLACQKELNLEQNKQYLIMGHTKDMWKLEKGWAYLLGSKTYILWWPEKEQSGGFDALVKLLEEFSKDFTTKGCQT